MYIILIEVFIMPVIRPSSDLRNNYNEISTICHQTKEENRKVKCDVAFVQAGGTYTMNFRENW